MKLKLDLRDCWSRDIAISVCLVMALVLIGLFFFLYLARDYSYFILDTVSLYVLLD